MKSKSLIISLFVIAVAQPIGGAEAPSTATNVLVLDAVLREVLARNPSLKAGVAAAEAMDARVPQERAWDDLRFGVDVERSGTTRFFDWSDNEWMISQALPLNGKNRQRARAASFEAEAARAEVRQRTLELVAKTRGAYARFANVHAQLELGHENETLIQQLIEVSRAKYSTGAATQTDALLAESELVKLLDARRDLERQLSEEQSQLNLLMGRAPQTPLQPPARGAVGKLNFSLDELQRIALASRPDLHAAQRRIDSAEARVGLAKKAWVPDPEIRVEARQVHGAGSFISEYDTGIFFNIPWVNRGKYRGAIAEAEKGRESAEHTLTALQSAALGAVRDQLKKVETARQRYTLFHDRLVPLARQTVDAARAAYVSGRGAFIEVITALRTVREVESMLLQQQAEYLVAVAELDAAVGRSPSVLMQPGASN
ncbi:MAG TPA: TolC family protein [Verrucomicrobiae bacterium]|jgi:outer membrane protein TolC